MIKIAILLVFAVGFVLGYFCGAAAWRRADEKRKQSRRELEQELRGLAELAGRKTKIRSTDTDEDLRRRIGALHSDPALAARMHGDEVAKAYFKDATGEGLEEEQA